MKVPQFADYDDLAVDINLKKPSNAVFKLTNRQIDGQTDGRIDGWMDRQSKGWIE